MSGETAAAVTGQAYMEKALNLVLQFLQSGRAGPALSLCRRLIAGDPRQADAFHLAGLIACQTGKAEIAVGLMARAVMIAPLGAQYHSNLGVVLKDLKRNDESISAYREAIRLEPGRAEAHFNLGNILIELGRYEEAVAAFRDAVHVRQDYMEAYSNLGISLQDLGLVGKAILVYKAAIAIRPDLAAAYNNFCLALVDNGQTDAALAAQRKSVALVSDAAGLFSNLGNVLRATGRVDEAMTAYYTGIAVMPDHADVYSNLGPCLKDTGDLQGAINACRIAVSLNPLLPEAQSNLLFMMNFDPAISPREVYEAGKKYDEIFGIGFRTSPPIHSNHRDPHRRLRVGYVSGDFRRHAVASFAEPIFANHDKAQVELICFSQVVREDEVTGRFRRYADQWHSTVGRSDDAVLGMIRALEVDILVDLAGHSAGNRIKVFAKKAAPLQVTYLGYPGTTGLAAMDYRITDRHADPDGVTDGFYTERLLRLPDSLGCFRPPPECREVTPLPALTNGYLTFGSFNNFNKIDAATLSRWAELLRAVPGSRLMMLTVPEGSSRDSLYRRFRDLGVGAERLDLFGKLPPAAFLGKILESDIALDPVSVCGGTTTCDTLWMGVPVIAMVGERFLTRVSYSYLNTVGLGDFAAFSAAEAVDIARRHAADLEGLANLRMGLRARMAASPLVDEVGFTRNLEALYRKIWTDWCR